MAQIFVHIGLPKTATTTLQTLLFPSIDQKHVKYLGVLQPREVYQSLEYQHFIQAVKSGSIEQSRGEIGLLLDSGQSLLISEEMILVSQEEADWHAKLVNLSNLLAGFDYKVIVTVREPIDAIHSYYIELYSQFSRENKSFLQLAKHDPRMEIFHYGKLFNKINMLFDRERVFVKKFEDIISGNIDELCNFLGSDTKIINHITLEDTNNKKKSSAFVYTGKNLTISGMIRKMFIKANIIDNRSVKCIKKTAKPIVKILDRFPITKDKVPKLGIEDKKDLQEYLEGETKILEHLYGIEYA